MASFHQLAAIMFTDIVGFTALMGSDEKRTMAIVAKNRKIHQTHIKNYNGRLLKEMGDGILASFTSVSEAVFCAGAIQSAANEQEINLKIGIHEGEVVFQDNDIYGDGVNIASRIEALAVTGEILLTESAYKNIKNKEGIQAEFVKEGTLKNVDEPVKIYRVREIISDSDTSSAYTYLAPISSSVETKSGSKRKSLLASIGILGLY
ncbi:MAG: adenylate/guanylate cyclase domain-containing protein [Cyclobacteriaceae bacterium]|nr:adenylate/guanylate cyclase domain-containing protein [Cyclobacteriaceae bacterium]